MGSEMCIRDSASVRRCAGSAPERPSARVCGVTRAHSHRCTGAALRGSALAHRCSVNVYECGRVCMSVRSRFDVNYSTKQSLFFDIATNMIDPREMQPCVRGCVLVRLEELDDTISHIHHQTLCTCIFHTITRQLSISNTHLSFYFVCWRHVRLMRECQCYKSLELMNCHVQW